MNRKETTEFLGRLLKKERFGGIVGWVPKQRHNL